MQYQSKHRFSVSKFTAAQPAQDASDEEKNAYRQQMKLHFLNAINNAEFAKYYNGMSTALMNLNKHLEENIQLNISIVELQGFAIESGNIFLEIHIDDDFRRSEISSALRTDILSGLIVANRHAPNSKKLIRTDDDFIRINLTTLQEAHEIHVAATNGATSAVANKNIPNTQRK